MKNRKRGLILAVSLLINIFIGSIYAWSIFAGPLTDEFGWAASAVALTFTIANGISPVTMVMGGKCLDKYGPRWIVFAGGILFGGGMIASGFIHSVGAIYITYGLCVGFGMGLVYSCTIANTVKFFPEKKGLVAGLSTGAYGLSTVILAPAIQKLIEISGVLNTFKVLGVVVLVVVCIGAQVLRKAPEQESQCDMYEGAAMEKNFAWKEMLKTRDFYLLLIMLTIGATAGLMIISQASSMAQDLAQVTPAQAALVVSLIALANGVGRILWGFISDRIGHYPVLIIMFVLLTGAMVALLGAGENAQVLFIGAFMLIGFCFGGFMAVFPALTADKFGIKNNGTNYGIMFCGFAIGGFLGPRFATAFRETDWGLYSMAFVMAGGMCAAGVILSVVCYKLMKNRN